ncbi:MAG: hypothetical protein IPQ07_21140 [Myxococcales bacterium]|nr:hypothetical protein [Myxococcales bacterium]
MSGSLPIIIAAATAGASTSASTTATATIDRAPRSNAITLAVPSLDGARGAQVGYERWLQGPRLGLTVSVQLREAAVGDYTGIRAGVGGELRWYWRARSFLHAQPTGSMIGWFIGGRVDVAVDTTHDDSSDRWLGTSLEIGTSALVGYRFAPWRGLEITPSAGLNWRYDVDLSGRLPGWSRTGIAGGLSVGWMF